VPVAQEDPHQWVQLPGSFPTKSNFANFAEPQCKRTSSIKMLTNTDFASHVCGHQGRFLTIKDVSWIDFDIHWQSKTFSDVNRNSNLLSGKNMCQINGWFGQMTIELGFAFNVRNVQWHLVTFKDVLWQLRMSAEIHWLWGHVCGLMVTSPDT